MPHTIEDLIASAVGQRPGDFEEVFNTIMLDRVGAAIDTRKQEVAQSLLTKEPEIEETND